MLDKLLNQMDEGKKEKLHIMGLVLLLLPFFHPGYVSVCVPWLDLIYKAGKVVSAMVVLVMGLKEVIKSRYLSKAAVALIVMECWMLAEVVLCQGFQGFAMVGIMSVLVVCALIEIQTRRHAAKVLEAFLIVYELLIGINFVTMLIYPNGMFHTWMQDWDNWFIGYRNMFIFYFTPALVLELIKKHAGGSAVRYYTMLAVCTASMIMGGSMTGLLCLLAFLAFGMTGIYRKKGCNILTVTVISLGAFISIVVLELQRYLKPVFDLLGRDVTFTTRTTIWQTAIDYIKQSPVVGYGIPPESVRRDMFVLHTAVTAHNYILEVLFCFGIVGMILTVIWLAVSAHQLYRNRKHSYAAAMCLGMISFHLVMLMEGEINNVPMYSFFFLTCCVERFIAQLPAKEKVRKSA